MLVVLWVDRGCSDLGSFDRISTMTIDRYCRTIDKTRNNTFECCTAKGIFGKWNMSFKKKSRAIKDAVWAYSIRVANQHFLVSRTLYCILIFLEKNRIDLIRNMDHFIFYLFSYINYMECFSITHTCNILWYLKANRDKAKSVHSKVQNKVFFSKIVLYDYISLWFLSLYWKMRVT